MVVVGGVYFLQWYEIYNRGYHHTRCLWQGKITTVEFCSGLGRLTRSYGYATGRVYETTKVSRTSFDHCHSNRHIPSSSSRTFSKLYSNVTRVSDGGKGPGATTSITTRLLRYSSIYFVGYRRLDGGFGTLTRTLGVDVSELYGFAGCSDSAICHVGDTSHEPTRPGGFTSTITSFATIRVDSSDNVTTVTLLFSYPTRTLTRRGSHGRTILG